MTAPSTPQRGRLFVISGPSGAGKGTLVKRLLALRPDLDVSVSATTRPARPGERHGIDYYFVSVPEFIRMRESGEFLESARVYDNLYGTPRIPVDRGLAAGHNVILELDIQGATAVKRAKPESVLIFIEPPSLDELFMRLRGRGTEDPQTLTRRLKEAYDEVKNKRQYDHIVVNDSVDKAVEDLVRIIEG